MKYKSDCSAAPYEVIIIGGGVVGSALARELSKYNLSLAVVEQEADVSEGTSKANSGVLHAGFNVKPGSLKARLNVQGLNEFPRLARELGIDYKICEKLVVASDESEFPYLERLLEQGRRNGSSGLSIIGQDEIRHLEPFVRGKRALHSRSTGIITPFQFNIALAENACDNGVKFFLSTRITGIKKEADLFVLSTNRGMKLSCRYLINSTGLSSHKIASMAGAVVPMVYPCRGEYFIVDRKAETGPGGKLLSMAVYPVPPVDGRGLGVHLTPTINGNILIGPSAEYVERKDALENTKEFMSLLKKEAYELLPELSAWDLIKSYAGNRAKLFGPEDCVSFADFHIEEAANVPGLINLVGIESPGLTSAPAIALLVKELLEQKITLVRKRNFNPRWRGNRRFSHLSIEERAMIVRKEPDYGEIICRCEGISRGEILKALDNPLGVRTFNGIKKRTYAMMGRCQSGFCLPRIVGILGEAGVEPSEAVHNSRESWIVKGEKQ